MSLSNINGGFRTGRSSSTQQTERKQPQVKNTADPGRPAIPKPKPRPKAPSGSPIADIKDPD